jgi:aminopeptidase
MIDPGTLQSYADLIVRVGLNLRAGQRLLIIGPLANGGVSLDAAPLVREVAASAYRAGAPLVETLWGDEGVQLARFRNASSESFNEFSAWFPRALTEHVEAGHAVLSISANDPDLLKGEPPAFVSALQQTAARSVRPFRELISRNQVNWTVAAAASPGWAARVFADVDPSCRMDHLWDAIVALCRLDRPDPVAAWQEHLDALAARRDALNLKRYDALKYRGPGTDLTIGLPADHLWVSGQSVSQGGILFAPNLPTEEVFTMPHRDRVNGTLRSSKPLSHGSTLIDDFTLTFKDGSIVALSAARGEEMLRRLVETDPGAARLGELALVPHGSPISQSGRLFYNTLFDENAASHVALGSAYRFTMKDGEGMTPEAFEAAGGNRSAVHVDFMIGSGELDIDGVLRNGQVEPLMRRGEWVDVASPS